MHLTSVVGHGCHKYISFSSIEHVAMFDFSILSAKVSMFIYKLNCLL